jgi:hypothetical protein
MMPHRVFALAALSLGAATLAPNAARAQESTQVPETVLVQEREDLNSLRRP